MEQDARGILNAQAAMQRQIELADRDEQIAIALRGFNAEQSNDQSVTDMDAIVESVESPLSFAGFEASLPNAISPSKKRRAHSADVKFFNSTKQVHAVTENVQNNSNVSDLQLRNEVQQGFNNTEQVLNHTQNVTSNEIASLKQMISSLI